MYKCQKYGRCSFHDNLDRISLVVVVVFTRGQIEDSWVWLLMSVMMMSVMMMSVSDTAA